MAARNKAIDIYNRNGSDRRKSWGDMFLFRNRASRASMSSGGSIDRQTTLDSARGSSIGRTKVGQMFDTEYEKQRQQDDMMAGLKSINEVDALRGVFYKFFEMKDINGKDNEDEKVLVSM